MRSGVIPRRFSKLLGSVAKCQGTEREPEGRFAGLYAADASSQKAAGLRAHHLTVPTKSRGGERRSPGGHASSSLKRWRGRARVFTGVPHPARLRPLGSSQDLASLQSGCLMPGFCFELYLGSSLDGQFSSSPFLCIQASCRCFKSWWWHEPASRLNASHANISMLSGLHPYRKVGSEM
jgi:hypothetical protein